MLEYKSCINLNLYRVFYYVAKEKSITKAAKSLYISQPAISKSLKKLEEELNTELFYRNLNGVELTEAGKVFYFYIEKAHKNLLMADHALTIYKNIPNDSANNWCSLS